ncbi:MAG: Holliday junction branch migration protein RuvA [Brevinema sp.]
MIGAIKGHVSALENEMILIETAGGVFYETLVSSRTANAYTEKQEILLHTSLIVRENEMYLTGFPSRDEKKLFDILITAKGIGPKQGLKILNALNPGELRMAIISGDTQGLARVKGVGAKKAEQLILDLREKIQKENSTYAVEVAPVDRKKTDILLTMRALGYTDAEIRKPLDSFFETCNQNDSIEVLASAFLRSLKS